MALDYRPDGMSMWDTWYLAHNGTAHVIYLQRLSPDSTRDPVTADWLGHATSTDLIHWQEHDLALGPGLPGSNDEMQPWTGCLVEHQGMFYLYYTMRSTISSGFGQRIGLATSPDMEHWTRYPGNPVIEPDPRWYISHENPLPRYVLDCRDLLVLPNPDRAGWIGFYAARVPAQEAAETAVIAAVRSDDLLHWEHLPPAFAPQKYACIEVPDVFELDGKWYMTCLTGHGYGNRGIFSDPSVRRGTIYAVADHPLGPYREIDGDNTLAASDATSGYSCRSLEFEGERYVFYTQPDPHGRDGRATLSPPMRLTTLPGQRLRLAYSDRTAAWREATLLGPDDNLPSPRQLFTHFVWSLYAGQWRIADREYHGESRTGWQSADLGVGAANVEVELTLTVDEGSAAGIVYRPNSEQDWATGDVAFFLDADEQSVVAAQLSEFDQQQRRCLPVARGQAYHVRVSIRPPRFEVFVDDILVLQGARELPELSAPSIGLFVDRGAATVRDLRIFKLHE